MVRQDVLRHAGRAIGLDRIGADWPRCCFPRDRFVSGILNIVGEGARRKPRRSAVEPSVVAACGSRAVYTTADLRTALSHVGCQEFSAAEWDEMDNAIAEPWRPFALVGAARQGLSQCLVEHLGPTLLEELLLMPRTVLTTQCLRCLRYLRCEEDDEDYEMWSQNCRRRFDCFKKMSILAAQSEVAASHRQTES